jgi:cobalt-precorrin 5A hydrolase
MAGDAVIVAGFGFRAGATEESLRAALAVALEAAAGLSGGDRVQALAAPADKADAPALVALAAGLGLPRHAVPLAALAAQTTITPAGPAAARYGPGSTAEAAALAAAGPGARLAALRAVAPDGRATCAIAANP